MIRQKKDGFSSLLFLLAVIWLTAYSVFMPGRTMETVRRALSVFVHSVLPSLALFSVCSKLLVKTGFADRISALPLKTFLKTAGLSPCGFSAFLIGSFAGFPTGAAMLAEFCERGEISKREAASILPFCNQAGASFLIGTVGATLFSDAQKGVIFFLAQSAAAWTGLCLTAFFRRSVLESENTIAFSRISVPRAVSASVKESVSAMLSVCGLVVFFSFVNTVLFDTCALLGLPVGKGVRALLGGLMELSFGFLELSSSAFSMEALLVLGGVLLGFGGVSVFMQVLERTEAAFYSPVLYFAGKLLTGMFCPLFSFLFFVLSEQKNGEKLIFVLFLTILCSVYLLNLLKIKFFSKKCGKMKRNAV
ncbi:MAG: hypothetical protein E7603_00085 [Ruminococcaceae bacterium]|nr:hypothetical protein [Oscillospiraceae bacterium]